MRAHNLKLVANGPSCGDCQAEAFCFHAKLQGEPLRAFKGAIRLKGPLRRGQPIYRAGQPFSSVYFIRQGSVKTEVCTVNGTQEVTAFYLVGELLGIDAIGCDHYPADAVTMEETWLCELPFDQLAAVCQSSAETQQALIMLLGRTLNADVYQWALARNLKAKQKVAWFIFDLFKRVRLRHAPNLRTIPLPMRKTDIANYLGLAPESLSRALHLLEKEGMIVNQGKDIYMSDIQMAKSLSTI